MPVIQLPPRKFVSRTVPALSVLASDEVSTAEAARLVEMPEDELVFIWKRSGFPLLRTDQKETRLKWRDLLLFQQQMQQDREEDGRSGWGKLVRELDAEGLYWCSDKQ
ncbi:hypothetical protein AXK11_05210 [Cephaloticoccus primus]|uniref:Uncharacterized protein n=1 Tax=Cephaloticoccus primus TaxID=1548207 RepID=A0A139SN05_9BACT|nr:hypothetical protein [Cephaloticoccus primus]KXU35925.1 hypothetical protein AXK11_05210 [Cephaloticoccus primus]